MKNEFDVNYDTFTKCILTSLFVGISAVYINLAFDMIFRYFTRYNLSAIINVSSIIMGCVILLLICGGFYYGFKRMFKGTGDLIFSIVFIAITVFAIYKVSGVVRSPIYKETIEFREELSGILVINGILAAIFIPLLFHKDKWVSKVI